MTVYRWCAVVAGVLYALSATLLLSLIVPEDNGSLVFSLLVLLPPLVGACVYLSGTAWAWEGRRGQISRIIGWLAMLPGAYYLVSLSFIVWPALLLMFPATLIRFSQARGLTTYAA